MNNFHNPTIGEQRVRCPHRKNKEKNDGLHGRIYDAGDTLASPPKSRAVSDLEDVSDTSRASASVFKDQTGNQKRSLSDTAKDRGCSDDHELNKEFKEVKVPYFRFEDKTVNETGAVKEQLVSVWISGALFALACYVSPFLTTSGGWDDIFNVLVQFAISVIFIEVNSGLFHIVFDNEVFNDWPILGPLAIDFQAHHFKPALITKWRATDLLKTIHGPALIICVPQVILTNDSEVLRPFWFFSIILVQVMFMAHRWAHIMPKDNHPIVRWCQDNGLLLSMREHIVHHKTYDSNWSIFTGWSNSMFNYITKELLSPENTVYGVIYVFYFLLPTLIHNIYANNLNGVLITMSIPLATFIFYSMNK
jgi:hypothetical protein